MVLDAKTALVTGGSSGIGLASAQLLRNHGARVAIIGSSQDKLERALTTLGEDVLAIKCDISSLDDLARMRDELGRRFGTRRRSHCCLTVDGLGFSSY